MASIASKESNMLLISRLEGAVVLARLNRPQQLNALNEELCDILITKLKELDQGITTQLSMYDSVRVVVLAGGQKAFAGTLSINLTHIFIVPSAAGADIVSMNGIISSEDALSKDLLGKFRELKTIRKPLIASVKGFALGGGCELAMMCDIVLASSDAQFGQPELSIGTIPGMGGTQRLTRVVGKSKAMEWILSGRRFSATEAERTGIVSRVIEPPQDVDEAAIELAREIARFPATTVQMAKECINRALETSLEEGLLFEKRAARDEGMSAFIEKRKPQFNVLVERSKL